MRFEYYDESGYDSEKNKASKRKLGHTATLFSKNDKL